MFNIQFSRNKSIYSVKINDINNINSRKNYNRFSVVSNVWRVCTFYTRILINNSEIEQQLRIIIYVILLAGITDITFTGRRKDSEVNLAL